MRQRTTPEAANAIYSDTGPFAIVPEWVLRADLSDRAVRLYAMLSRYADTDGYAFPSRRRLAADLGCSTKSIDRAVSELEQASALQVEPRRDEAGDRTTNLYLVRRLSPGRDSGVATGRDTAVQGGRDTGVAVNESQVEREPEERKTGRAVALARTVMAGPKSVNRRRVTSTEVLTAHAILDVWNELAGQSLRSNDWLAKIIMRLREYPEATLDDHRLIIQTALANPWWQGPPSPSVVYGNGAQFERSIQQVRAMSEPTEDERLAQIVRDAAERRTA